MLPFLKTTFNCLILYYNKYSLFSFKLTKNHQQVLLLSFHMFYSTTCFYSYIHFSHISLWSMDTFLYPVIISSCYWTPQVKFKHWGSIQAPSWNTLGLGYDGLHTTLTNSIRRWITLVRLIVRCGWMLYWSIYILLSLGSNYWSIFTPFHTKYYYVCKSFSIILA